MAELSAPALEKKFTLRNHMLVSCMWLAYNVQWGALLAVVLPAQIAAMVGEDRKEFYNGLVGPAGALVALVATPIAGALSDRSRHKGGRRRGFLITGILINIAFLLMMAGFGQGSSIALFAAVYMGVQLGCNWWGGPYAGLIPDVVPEKDRGLASGWMALMTAIGTVIGALSAGQLIREGSYLPVYILIAISLALTLAATVAGVREPEPAQDQPRFNFREFIRTFLVDPKEHRDFYWVLITRAMVTMGIYSVFTFFQYFLQNVIGLDRAGAIEKSSFLIGIITVMGIPTSIVAGGLSDKHGRKPLIYASGGVMALASIIWIAVAAFPSLGFTYAVAALFGIGYGAYQAVDWALAIDVLPGGEDAAKDMGIWHIAMVLPQVIAPAVTGMILTAVKGQSVLLGYSIVFVITAVWFVLGTVFVRQIRGVR